MPANRVELACPRIPRTLWVTWRIDVRDLPRPPTSDLSQGETAVGQPETISADALTWELAPILLIEELEGCMETGAVHEEMRDTRRAVEKGRLRVAIATNDEAWRPVEETLSLERLGLEVIRVGSVTELLEIESLDQLDMAVLDQSLPAVGGLAAGAMLREINPTIRLVLAAPDASWRTRRLAEEFGFAEVMEKTEDGFGLYPAAGS